MGDHQEQQKRWAGRFHNDMSTGVMLQLLLTLKDAAALPMARDALVVDTFVDDTYQNLQAAPNENRYTSQPPPVSADGQHVMLTVASSRAPSSEAERLFVRGSLNARLMRGKPETASAKLAVKVGAQAQIGPFKTAMRSVADNGRNLTITLAVSGDASRIRQVGVLSRDGAQINDDEQQYNRFMDHGGRAAGGEQVSTLHVNIPPAQEELTVEYTYAQKVEDVRIPFEAQVDIGQTKAGPIEATAAARKADAGGDGSGGAGAKTPPPLPPQAGGRRTKPWPPPALASDAPGAGLPPRRSPFDPTTRPAPAARAELPKLKQAAVDVFSLTLSKPAPGEVEGVAWTNPPPRSFSPAGFTIARLMLSTPGVQIMSVPSDGVTVTRFEDDKGQHDTAMYVESSSRGGFRNDRSFLLAPDGQQALLAITMASAPTPGATRCTLAGEVKAQVALGDKIEASQPVPFAKGHRVKVGPVEVHFADIRQVPPLTPDAVGSGSGEVWLGLFGELPKVRSVELLDAATSKPIGMRPATMWHEGGTFQGNNVGFGMPFGQAPPEKVIVRVRHFEKLDTVTVPFEVTTGVGL